MAERRFLGLPIHRNTPLGEVPGAEVPSISNHNGEVPKTAAEFEELTTELNGGIPLSVLAKELEEAKKAGIAVRHFILKVPFRDSQGWKIAAGVAGLTLTAGAAMGFYEVTKRILDARNKTHK